jgi:hypothetical protein
MATQAAVSAGALPPALAMAITSRQYMTRRPGNIPFFSLSPAGNGRTVLNYCKM